MNFLKILIAPLLLASIGLLSCRSNCANTECTNGQCDEKSGQCVCIDGWYGESCNLSTKTDANYGVFTLYTDEESYANAGLSVYIDSVYAGTFSHLYTSTPECGDANSITLTLIAGYHLLEVYNGSIKLYSGDQYIYMNDCSVIRFYAAE